MSEDRITKVILSNMCMLYKDDEYLIINRTKSDWPGLSFPGGHVEDGETLEESIIREMKEELDYFISSNLEVLHEIKEGCK